MDSLHLRFVSSMLLALMISHLLRPTLMNAADRSPDAFVADQIQIIRRLTQTAEKSNQIVLTGREGWNYLVAELRAISIGEFWGKSAITVSRATKPEYADPIEAILDFHQQLREAEIELLLVPVPAKLSIYPEPLLEGTRDHPSVRLDVYHQQFYRLLAHKGVEVIDLSTLFLKERDQETGSLYCKSDSHWSGRGVTVAADTIAKRIKKSPWYQDLPVEQFASAPRQITIRGDLAKLIDGEHANSETLPVTVCGRLKSGQIQAVEPSRSSPILLMGDSHTLVFHESALFAQGAGLPDHLAERLGFAVDLIGVRGSGSTATRIELVRRKDNLSGKKLVIWCFSCREFTESESGWRKVPVIRR